MLSPGYADELRQVGHAAGLDAMGIATAEPFSAVAEILVERREAGLAGDMQFTYRNPTRSTDPAATMPGVASLVVGALRYHQPSPSRPRGVVARVARYATADHYASLRAALGQVAARLQADGWQARVVADDNALVDRAAARRAGLGWYGKNANLLVPGLGSWVVLGSVLTDAPLPPTAHEVADGCGGCTRCLASCPTGAIVAPGVVDARRCLAWLVQAPGMFPIEHRAGLGDRLYGCDTCQEVCPPSILADRSSTHADLAQVSGSVPSPGPWVEILAVLEADDAELLARFGRWYIPRREPRHLRRNALVVLGNSGRGDDPDVIAALGRALADRDPLVRAHGVWAARRLGLDGLLASRAAVSELDLHPWVRAELDRAPDEVMAS